MRLFSFSSVPSSYHRFSWRWAELFDAHCSPCGTSHHLQPVIRTYSWGFNTLRNGACGILRPHICWGLRHQAFKQLPFQIAQSLKPKSHFVFCLFWFCFIEPIWDLGSGCKPLQHEPDEAKIELCCRIGQGALLRSWPKSYSAPSTHSSAQSPILQLLAQSPTCLERLSLALTVSWNVQT